MVDKWITLPLQDCMSAIIDYRGKTPRKTDFGIPLVTAKIVKGGRIVTPEEFIDPSDFDSWMTRGLPKKGDVVMTTEAPLGEVAQLDGAKVALAQRIITLRGKDDLLDNGFLRYLLQSTPVQEEMKARATGTTVLGIKQSELRKISLCLPPLAEQKRIAQILGALDDKIELNRRMSGTLEAMAHALFQSWFVDFDPVTSKLDGRQPSGMDPITAALFSSDFCDSALGKIPTGWSAPKLSEILTESSERIGKTPAPEYSSTNDGLQLRSERYSKALAASSEKNKLVKNGYFVFGLSRRVLNFGLMKDEIGSVSSAYKVFRVNEQMCSPELLERYMRLKPSYFFKAVSSSSREGQSVSNESLGSLRFIQAPQSIQKAYHSFCEPAFERIRFNNAQSQTLSTFRDTLTPKLMSGDFKFQEIESL